MRYLFGPIWGAFPAGFLVDARQSGACRLFGEGAVDIAFAANSPDLSWERLVASIPPDEQPQFLMLWLTTPSIPESLWNAPIPIIGLSPNWPQHWNWLRTVAGRCKLLFTDSAGVQNLKRAGINHARPAILCGLPKAMLNVEAPSRERDVDVLVVGDWRPATPETERWLARLAGMASPQRRVIIPSRLTRAEYRDLLGRAKIVFNYSARGCCNPRVFEAIGAGALLMQEARNSEVRGLLKEGREFAAYDDGNLEAKIDYHLKHADKRTAIAGRAHRRAPEFTFESFWSKVITEVEGAVFTPPHATSAYALWLDADEHFDPPNIEKLKQLITNLTDTRVAYLMKQVSVNEGATTPDAVISQVRLFRNDPRHRWTYRFHEQITPSLAAAGSTIAMSPVVVLHRGYRDPELSRRKLERNLNLVQLDLEEQPNDAFSLFNLGAAFIGLKRPADALPPLQRALENPALRATIAGKLVRLDQRLLWEARPSRGSAPLVPRRTGKLSG